MADPGFWNDQAAAREVIDDANRIKGWTEPWTRLDGRVTSLAEMLDLLEAEEDEAMLQEVAAEVEQVGPQLEDLELRNILQGPDDTRDALVFFFTDTGSTESQDW